MSAALNLLKQPRTWFAPYVIGFGLCGLLPRTPTDLEVFFWPAARVALAGRPLFVYSVHGQDLAPNANGPVALAPLVAVEFVARALGWLDAYSLRRVLVLAVFGCFVIVMAHEAVLAVERLRGRPLDGMPRLLAYATFALGPPVWQSLVQWGHIEQPIEVWLVLVAARLTGRGWAGRAGITFGLAVLTRTAAALTAVPLAFAVAHRRPRSTAQLFATAALTAAAGVLPFVLADPADAVHSLFTYRGALPPAAGSIWSLADGGTARALAQHWDVALVAGVALLANGWLASRPGGFTEQRLFAGLALTATSFTLLAKTVWPYYFFEVFVFATVWAFGTWRRQAGLARLVVAPVATSALAMVAEIGSAAGQPASTVALEGSAMFVMLAATCLWIAGVASSGAAEVRAAPAPAAGRS